jgi:AraC-like DNA-binding protein
MTGTGFIMHWHDEFEVLHITDGYGRHIVGADPVDAGAGDSVIINSNVLHNITATRAPYKFKGIMINKIFCLQNQIELDNMIYPAFIRDAELSERISSIIQEDIDKKNLYKPLIRAKLIELMVFLSRNYGKRQVCGDMNNWKLSPKLSLVKSCLTYIRNNFQSQFTIDELCRAVGVSKYYLCHVFKKATNKTIVEYINIIRCEYARELLNSGKFNVTQCAEKSGFQDNSYFSRIYKRHMGVLPSTEKSNIVVI